MLSRFQEDSAGKSMTPTENAGAMTALKWDDDAPSGGQ